MRPRPRLSGHHGRVSPDPDRPAGGGPEAGNHVDRRGTSRLTWLVPLAALATLVLLYFAVPGVRSFFDRAWAVLSTGDEARIRWWVDQFGGWGAAVIVGSMLLQTVAVFLPSLSTMVVAVLAYGPVLGGLLAWGGMIVAATLGYGIGALIGPSVVGRLLSPNTEEKLERYVGDATAAPASWRCGSLLPSPPMR